MIGGSAIGKLGLHLVCVHLGKLLMLLLLLCRLIPGVPSGKLWCLPELPRSGLIYKRGVIMIVRIKEAGM